MLPTLIDSLRHHAELYFLDKQDADQALPHIVARLQRRAAAAGKRCDTCWLYKPLGEFARDAERMDALRYSCKSCEAARKAEARRRAYGL